VAEDEQLLIDRVRELRAAGHSPKDIARATGLRPARVGAIVRELGRESYRAEGEGALVGAWINPGWSAGLGIAEPPAHAEWPDDPVATGVLGLVGVLVARRGRPGRLTVGGYLVDVYCLGVKNALGPMVMGDRDLDQIRGAFFGRMGGGAPLPAPLDLVQHLVLGAVGYARTLGFSPHPDFAEVAGLLGEWSGPSAITFGHDGVPTYFDGPDDDPRAVLRTLTRTVGEGNFHYTVGAH
jgi:hypothetical protein